MAYRGNKPSSTGVPVNVWSQTTQVQAAKPKQKQIPFYSTGSKRDDVIICCLILCVVLYFWWFIHGVMYPQRNKVFSCPMSQTLYVQKPHFYDEDVFQDMRERLINSDLAKYPNALDAGNFGSTTGIVIMFNLQGVERFRSNTRFKDLVSFFDRIRWNDTNAFVVNILRTQPKPDEGGKDTAAGDHLDDTLMAWEPFWIRTTFVSHVTTVLYLSVPEDMEGGEFVVRPPPYAYNMPTMGEVIIRPEENMMLSFRGDAHHHVRGYRTATQQCRVSLVVEQYKIEPELYHKTFTYWQSSRRSWLRRLI